MLRGVAGVQLVGGDGLNDLPHVYIRGTISIMGKNEPLFIVNGREQDKSLISLIMPSMVKYIQVLKGTDAAIYGARGAGGVIVITLK